MCSAEVYRLRAISVCLDYAGSVIRSRDLLNGQMAQAHVCARHHACASTACATIVHACQEWASDCTLTMGLCSSERTFTTSTTSVQMAKAYKDKFAGVIMTGPQ